MNKELAIFGGSPLFAQPRPVGQLAAPDVERFIGDLKKMHAGASGSESAVDVLEQRLCAFHEVPYCIAITNAAVGLVMLMAHLANGRRGEVIMPAFSYRGLPHFAQWAGQRPRFCDVERSTHGLDPRSVEATIGADTTAILGVNNFNSPCAIDELVAIGARYNVPVFFDSVYGLGATFHGEPLGRFGAAEVFSLHATKLLNGFEGGYITTSDSALAQRLRDMRDGQPVSATLNRIHALMALLCLDDLNGVIERNEARYRSYQDICTRIDGLELLPYLGDGTQRHNYEMANVEILPAWPLTRDETVKVLRAENAAITSYYSPPLHRGPHAPKGVPVPELPVSQDLAKRFLQLPVGEHTTIEDVEALGGLLEQIQATGPAIARRLRDSA